MKECIFVLPLIVVTEFQILRQDMPQILLDAPYTDTGQYRSFNIPPKHINKIYAFIELLDEIGRDYRLMCFESPSPVGN